MAYLIKVKDKSQILIYCSSCLSIVDDKNDKCINCNNKFYESTVIMNQREFRFYRQKQIYNKDVNRKKKKTSSAKVKVKIKEKKKETVSKVKYRKNYSNTDLPYIWGYFINDKKSDSWSWYYKNGKTKKEGNYINDKKNGIWMHWTEEGKEEKVESYNDGKKDGKWVWWNENGKKVREEYYKNGKKDGIWIYWNEEGKKERLESYKDGKKDGDWCWYYKNINLQKKGTYKSGKMDGKWALWNINGIKEKETLYKNGNTISVCRFWDNGKKHSLVKKIENNIYSFEKWYKNGEYKEKGKLNNSNENIGRWFFYKQDGAIKEYKDY